MDELPHQVEHAVTGPGLLPKVGRGVTVPRRRNGRIAGSSELALVEGQKPRRGSGELGSHVDEIGVNGEMREAATTRKQRLPRISRGPVLANGVSDRLAVQRVLELRREDGDTVEEERNVEAIAVLLAVVKLPDDREQVGRVQPSCVHV